MIDYLIGGLLTSVQCFLGILSWIILIIIIFLVIDTVSKAGPKTTKWFKNWRRPWWG